ncbi:glycosyltransferase [Actinoplanes sp. NPDC051475]|uniref:glycosyltransferase n=1 Tax=Actinoplanes sp. NPDC051475 TaxID=3157225 RepID=UPI00344B2794
MTDLLLCDLAPYRYSTRTRKVAAAMSERLDTVEAITLARVGRVGMEDVPGSTLIDGVRVKQLPTRRLDDNRTFVASIRNILFVYVPALILLRREVARTQAGTIFVGHVSLFWIGLAHQRKWASRVVISGRERPGAVRTKGSLATWFSRIEPALLRYFSRRHKFAVVAVCESHAEQFRELGVEEVVVVRNVPSASFVQRFSTPPGGDELIVALVGSLYPGRGIEALIRAVVIAQSRGARVRLNITGHAGESYLDSLRALIEQLEARPFVALLGPCSPKDVALRYQEAHVGTALYEATDKANDSLSNKLFESVVSGRPVIAGNLPENSKVIASHNIGWTSAVTPDSLSDLLTVLARDIESVRQKASHCYQVGQQHFVWEREVSRLESIMP